jgi:hypothetical protein
MPYVFISHLSDDSSRLGIYIDRLLEALDKKIDLWIDTPERIRAEFGSNSRIKAIPPGAQWNPHIERALENAGCVLAFWSKNFPWKEDRNVFIREIDRGRKYDCCVQIAVDPKADCKIRAPFDDDQILEVIDIENNPQHKQMFDRVVARMKELIEAPERMTPALPVPEHLLPYLVNRHPQIRPICRTVRKNIGAPVGEQKIRPALFVVPCRNYDATDTFSRRLVSKDGPEYFGFDQGRDTPDWVKEENISWPRHSTPDDFADSFKSYNEDAVREALKKSKSRSRPVCFSTWVDVTIVAKQFGAFIAAWMRAWPSLIAEATEKITLEDVRLLPQPPVVALLFLRFESERGVLSRLFGSASARVAKYCYELQRIEMDATCSSAVDFRALEPLALVTRDDATTWLTLDDVFKNGAYYALATTAIDDLFERQGSGVPMKEFARRCLRPTA